MITTEAIAHRAGLLAQENEMTEIERLTKTLSQFAIDILGDYGVLPEAATNDPEFLDTCHVEAVAILAALRPTPALDARALLIAERQRWWTPEYPGQTMPVLAVWFRDEPEDGLSGFDTEGDRDRFHAGEHGPFFRRVTGNEYRQVFDAPEAQRLAPQIGGLAAERVKREAAEVALRHKAKVAVNEELWHEGQDWACQRINDAILALPTGYTEAQLDAEAMARPKLRALIGRLERIADGGDYTSAGMAREALLDLKGAEHE